MITGIRDIFIKGTPLEYLQDQIIPMSVLGGVLFMVNMLNFRKKKT